MFVDVKDQTIDRKYEDYFNPITAHQLASYFPDERILASKRLRRLFADVQHYKETLKDIIQSDMPDDQKYLHTIWIKTLMHLDPAIKEINLLDRYLQLTEKIDPVNIPEAEKLNVERAKQVPIQSLFSADRPRESSKLIICRCPFHDEKSGSFTIYKNDNRYKCFGCGVSGDSIHFIMQMYSVDFITAVRRLTNEYRG